METFENALAVGTVLESRYRIESILGEDGFGITYKAHDDTLNYTVVVKEYFPVDCAARGADSTIVQPRANRADDFQFGLEQFVEEARIFAKHQITNMIRINNILNANGTAYYVKDFEEGSSLDIWLQQHKVIDEKIIISIVEHLLQALTEIHANGLLHRDINPANIIIRKQGGSMLIDSGNARHAIGERNKSIASMLSPGYAAPEQYTSRGRQGAFTDIYAIGAVLYRLITGKDPIEATDRVHDVHEGEPDPLLNTTEAGEGKVSNWLLILTDQLLSISSKERPQTAEAVLAAMQNKSIASFDMDMEVDPFFADAFEEVSSPPQEQPDQSVEQAVDKQPIVQESTKKAEAQTPEPKAEPEKRAESQPKSDVDFGATMLGAKPKRSNGLLIAFIIFLLLVAAVAGVFYAKPELIPPFAKNLIPALEQKPEQVIGKAVLDVSTQPKGAKVYLDNQLIGETPLMKTDIVQGEYDLLIKHTETSDHIEKVSLKDLVVKTIKVSLKPATGQLTINSEPAGAAVVIDGKSTGKVTPYTDNNISVGDHKITLTLDKYYPLEKTITVSKTAPVNQSFKLKGGNLVEYKGKWVEPTERDRLIAAEKKAAATQAKKLAAEKEKKRLAAEKAKRLAAEKERKRLEAEKAKRLAAEKAKRLTAEKERKRLAAEAEAKRIAAEKERKRLAEIEEAKRLEAEKEKQRIEAEKAKELEAQRWEEQQKSSIKKAGELREQAFAKAMEGNVEETKRLLDEASKYVVDKKNDENILEGARQVRQMQQGGN